MRILTLTICVLIHCGSSIGQCDNITLRSQAEVDSFILKNGPCTSVNTLHISGRQSAIYNLDSLYHIEEVNWLTFIGDSIFSVSGMTSLKKVDILELEMPTKGIEPFPRLDTIVELDHDFLDPTGDLSVYSQVIFIETLNLFGNGLLDGLIKFEPHRKFSLNFYGNELGDNIDKILKGHKGRLAGLSLSSRNRIGSKNFNLAPFKGIDSIDILGLHRVSNIDLTPILGLTNINELYLSHDDEVELNGGFTEIHSLERLWVSRTTKMKSLKELVPNIRRVRYKLSIRYNESLESIDVVSNFPPLERTKFERQNEKYIEIVNNPELASCNNKFVCDAVMQFEFPDSLIIYLNGPYCTYDSLVQNNCLSLATTDAEDEIKIAPNPTTGTVYVNVFHGDYKIYDVSGKQVTCGNIENSRIDMQQLKSGIYLLEIVNSAEQYCTRVIKQ